MENSIMCLDPPDYGKKNYFFSETRPFFEHFLQKVYFHHWKFQIASKIFHKMISLLLDKQIFASSDARFCRDTRNDGQNMCNFSLSMYLWSLGGGLRSPKGGPPLYMKKNPCLKLIFMPFGKKNKNWMWKMTLADPTPSPPIMEFSIIFFNPSLMNIFLHSTGDNLACSRAP